MTFLPNVAERHVRKATVVLFVPLVFGVLAVNSALWQQILEHCRTAWSVLAHGHAFALLLLPATALFLASFARAAWFVFREVRQYRQWQQRIAVSPCTARSAYGVPYILVDHAQPFVLTHGFVHPTTYLSTGLRRQLHDAECMGVLLHEARHREVRDPARLFGWRFLVSVLFFLPLVRAVGGNVLTDAETAADQRAVARGVPARSLLTAMAKVMQSGGSIPTLRSAEFAVRPRLHERLARLHGDSSVRPLPLGSLLATVVLVLVLASPALAFVVREQAGADAAMWCPTPSPRADRPSRAPQSVPVTLTHYAL